MESSTLKQPALLTLSGCLLALSVIYVCFLLFVVLRLALWKGAALGLQIFGGVRSCSFGFAKEALSRGGVVFVVTRCSFSSPVIAFESSL